ncbi:hypothetical protein J6590_022578 [Homalodisca vitripennis]|nr:hypothetical protein J6590_022578 [Homalodisca vitripennis]
MVDKNSEWSIFGRRSEKEALDRRDRRAGGGHPETASLLGGDRSSSGLASDLSRLIFRLSSLRQITYNLINQRPLADDFLL